MRSPAGTGLTCGAARGNPAPAGGQLRGASLLYRAEVSADPATTAAEASAEQAPASAEIQPSGAGVLTKRAQAERAYAVLSVTGAPVSAGQLAAAAGLSASYARALVAEFHTRPPATPGNVRPAAGMLLPEADPGTS